MERFIFPVPTPSYSSTSYPGELIWLPHRYPVKIENQRLVREPGDVCTPALFFNFPSARYLLLYFHGNAEDLGRTYGFCAQLQDQFHLHVLAAEYPGYGIASGTVSASGVLSVADAALKFVKEVLNWEDDSIIVMGRSIGTAPATHLASKHPNLCGLVLVSPFTSITKLIEEKLGTLAKFLPIPELFDNLALASYISCPAMVIHGQKDAIVPVEHGKEIYALLKARRIFVSPVKMSHNSYLFSDPRMMAVPMLHFFNLPDYSVSGDFTVPTWAFDARLASNAETPCEVVWNSTTFAQNPDAFFPTGDTDDFDGPPELSTEAFLNRPPRHKGDDGEIEDYDSVVDSKLGLNYTQTKSLSGLRIRLPSTDDRQENAASASERLKMVSPQNFKGAMSIVNEKEALSDDGSDGRPSSTRPPSEEYISLNKIGEIEIRNGDSCIHS